jgi:hypothetical protein
MLTEGMGDGYKIISATHSGAIFYLARTATIDHAIGYNQDISQGK